MHLLVDVEEAVLGVGLFDFLLQQQGAIHRPAVQVDHVLGGDPVDRRIEAGQVGEQEARGITDAAIGVGAALQDLVGDRHLAGVVGRSDPEAQDVGAQAVDDLLRSDHVAQRLGLLATLLVHGEAVGQQFLVGGMAVDGATGQQRGVEPATVLVRAFQVEIGRRTLLVRQFGMGAAQHVPVGGTRVEPDVEGVAALVVLAGFFAKQFDRIELEPGFDAFTLDALGDLLHQLDGARVQLAAFLVGEERNRHTPVALTRDAPVGTTGDHAVQARLAPGGDELGLLDGCQRTLAQGSAFVGLLVHADEPLGGSAIDQWGLVAPAVHVAVIDRLVLEQGTCLFQRGDDGRIGLPDELATKQRQRLDIDTVALYRIEDVVVAQAVLLADAEVVLAIGGRAMHDTRARAQLDILGQVDG